MALLLAPYRRHRAGRTTAQAFAQETASPLRELRKLVKEKPQGETLPRLVIVRRIVEKDGTLSPFVLRHAPTPENPRALERVPWTEPEEAQVSDSDTSRLTGDELALLEADLTTRAVRGTVTKTAASLEAQVLGGIREGLKLTAPLGVNTRLAIRRRIPFPPNAQEART